MNTYYVGGFPITDELYHHGIKGQKWGIRRYQNPDGTLTAEGRKHYYGDKNFDTSTDYLTSKQADHLNNITEKEFKKAYLKTVKDDRKKYYGPGIPNEIAAANKTYAREIIKNSKNLKAQKEKLYKALEPELEFETNRKLWKKYGYDPENIQGTIHDVWDQYYDAKEKYMSDRGLSQGSKERKQYDKNRTVAFDDYNYYVRSSVNDVLGYHGNTPVSVTTKYGDKYYSVAREAIRKSLTFGYHADPFLSSSDGALDFYSLADQYERDKKK